MTTHRNHELTNNENSTETKKGGIDKFLLAIVIGAVVLVGIAIGVTLLQPEPDYLPEDTPEGVAHNYLLALDKGEYQRADSYLSPNLPGYPITGDAFAGDIDENSYWFGKDEDTTLRVESSKTTGN